MRHFASAIHQLRETAKTNKKISILAEYFATANERDKIWALALLTGRRPKRPVKTSLLRLWAAEIAEIPNWLFEESYHITGDLAECMALLMPFDGESVSENLHHIMEELKELTQLSDELKSEYVKKYWQKMNRKERFVFNKLLTGGFRIGISQSLTLRSLEKATGIKRESLAHRITGNWEPHNTTFEDLIFSKDSNDDLSKPYPFYLAYPIENPATDLAEFNQWTAEFKWDGIRGQLIYRDKKLFVWSRGEELVTDQFPEFEKLIDRLPVSCVLDGEILPFKDGKTGTFNELQKRLGRKKVSKKMIEEYPVLFKAYDIFEYKQEDFRQEKLTKRRDVLHKIVESTDLKEVLQFSESLDIQTSDDFEILRNRARYEGAEGIMIKHKDSRYEQGRKRGNWWKFKAKPFSLDMILTYAMRGHGRRANLFTDYTFALLDKEGMPVTVAKAYSGLSDLEFKEVNSFIRKNAIDKFGPVRQVKAELVFEIAFENIRKSGRHKSGYALRFPRIARWRRDKPAVEADTLEALKQIHKKYFS
ncbi:MAG: ATP-dependent DNA ligase [Chitinophagaceae bacterium]|nr:MAG: ATP-dependent DNA ligase [Chitinophagaceae bacterium]